MRIKKGDVFLSATDIEAAAYAVNEACRYLEIGLAQKAADTLQVARDFLPDVQLREIDPHEKLHFRGF